MMNRIMILVIICFLIGFIFAGWHNKKMSNTIKEYEAEAVRVESEAQKGWIEIRGKVHLLVPIDQHESCAPCHDRSRDKRMIVEDFKCPRWNGDIK